AECVTAEEQATPGSRLPFTLRLIARTGNMPVQAVSIKWPDGDTTCRLTLLHDSLYALTRNMTIPEATSVTEPYWMSVPPKDDAHFPLPADTLLGLPVIPNQLNAVVTLSIGGETLRVPVPLSSK